MNKIGWATEAQLAWSHKGQMFPSLNPSKCNLQQTSKHHGAPGLTWSMEPALALALSPALAIDSRLTTMEHPRTGNTVGTLMSVLS